MFIIIIGAICLFFVFAVVIVDAVPIFSDWLQRVGIGRVDNKAQWRNKISKIGADWLNSTPKIKITDNSRLILIDMLRRQYSSSAIQHWQEAALILGISEQLNAEPEIKSKLNQYLNRTFDSQGGWRHVPKHIDGAILAFAVMKIPNLDLTFYKPALEQVWEIIQQHIGEEGTVAYRTSMMNYRYVDTIGFICPFLMAYGMRFGNESSIELAYKQIKTYERFGMLSSEKLPFHAYRVDSKVPMGIYGWGRGLGWYAIGLIDAWRELQPEHKYKQPLEDSIREFALAALKYQQDNGAWNWSVTRSECRPDSSATAMLGWFMLNASELEGLQNVCRQSAERAIGFLMTVTRRNGVVDFSQGDTKDIGVYSMIFNQLPFTQGLSMRLSNRG